MCIALVSVVPQSLLGSGYCFLSSIFRELFSIERISGNTET
ncbi:hypothetical protein Golob_012789 [Gossypium lobatum]|uniref:Uncharacterized protein n=1 Tax=Gossypium lobatum TaxID=34289 RepID=A0A7J8LMJ0_9ROSI|nr:hypothetical protein [Gossypium lobatum]